MKLTKSASLDNLSEDLSLREFVSSASQRPVSGSVITRVNFPLTADDMEVFDRYSEAFHAKRVSILRAALQALQNLDEDAQADLIRQKEISSPKPGRQPVNK
jgi:hypothetical protein